MGATDPTDAAESETRASTASATPPTREAIRERLDRVHDPELDRSIVELEYVESVDVDGGAVTVTFVLPTAWCSPAFAWMMATGIRDEVGSLPGVSSVTVRLPEHMHGEEITAGVNEGRSFEAVFEDAEDGVEAVRRKLDEKARFARQYDAMRALEDAGLDPHQMATLTLAEVDLAFRPDLAAVSLQDGDLTVTVPREDLADYLEKARETGVVTDESDRLFADREGNTIEAEPEAVESVRRDARLAASNVDGQAAICASLLESRYDVGSD